MPPPAAAVVALDQFVDDPEPLDELLLLPQPAASTTVPMTAAMATPVFFVTTFSPPTCMATLGQDASIVARKGEGAVSENKMKSGRFMNGGCPEEEFLYGRLAAFHSGRINRRIAES